MNANVVETFLLLNDEKQTGMLMKNQKRWAAVWPKWKLVTSYQKHADDDAAADGDDDVQHELLWFDLI